MVDGKQYKAHRFAYGVTNGFVPPSVLIRHSCDNPPCCNPGHLLTGSPADNMRDRDERGRHVSRPGETNGSSKLLDAQAAEIRARFLRGESAASIARDFPQVTYCQTNRIARRYSRTKDNQRGQ